jgi:alpha-1,3-mannosyltransferase
LKVVHVCRTGWPALGGLEASVGGLALAQHRAGHDVRVVTLDRDGTGRALPEQVIEGVRYQRLRRVGPRRYPLAAGLLGAVAGADVVHAHGLDGLTDRLVAGRRRHGIPVGVSTHGGYLHTRRLQRIKQVWLRTGTRWILGRADAVWFSSEADRQRLAPARARGRVIPDGVDVERFARVVRRPVPGTWLVPGRLDVHKGLDDLMLALDVLARRDERPFRVEIAGRDWAPGLRARLEAQALRLGLSERVVFLGELSGDDLLRALGRAELVLLPSRYEGFGIAAVEAMAARVPVVVADVPALRDHVEDGVSGFVAPFRDPTAAADVLARVRGADLADLAERAAAAAARHAWPARAAELTVEYERLVSR